MLFSELQLSAPILKALEEEGYKNPTPIQEKSIPVILGGFDLLGCAQTGTGKTAAFALPIIQRLSKGSEKQTESQASGITKDGKKPFILKRRTRCLILTPTRELASQIKESFDAYGRHTKLRSTVIFGGVGQGGQIANMREGVDIVIATPGRLLDLISQGHVRLTDIEIFVLDEADRMLDMGFIHDVRKIISMLPERRQTLFFSATMPKEIVKLSDSILYKPARVTVTPVSSTAEIIAQKVYHVDKANKPKLLLDLLNTDEIKTALVFTRTKHGANKVVKLLLENKIPAEAIHGNKAQSARQKALANFKAQTTRVLVATDIAARGIDIDELEHVINFEIPNISETYVHRIGRTGRAGARGIALSFCDIEERAWLRDIEQLIAKSIPVIENHPYPATRLTEPAFLSKTGSKPTKKVFEKKEGGKFAPKDGNGHRKWDKERKDTPRKERPERVRPEKEKPTWDLESGNLGNSHRREKPRPPKSQYSGPKKSWEGGQKKKESIKTPNARPHGKVNKKKDWTK
ncbi:MAG: DEAD/DEAH box helicase [Candidatus Altimarinota bacterium]